MKKFFCVVLSIVLCAVIFSSCGAGGRIKKNDDGGKISVVCLIFPQYDWVKNVIGDKTDIFDITLLISNGADMHSYQPSYEDILKARNADIFMFVGGESDEWASEAAEENNNENRIDINLMEITADSAIEEQTGVNSKKGDEEEKEYDEHVFLSLKNAEKFVGAISQAVCEKDEENAAEYRKNAENYISELRNLDERYEETVRNSKLDTIIFPDRFPFIYLFTDYNIKYYAAFAGCSAESEASFNTMIYLIEKVDEIGTEYVMTIDGSDKKLAETVVRNAKKKNIRILTLDSMQSVSLDDIDSGETYLSVMEKNLEMIKKALN